VLSYLPVDKQREFGEQIIPELKARDQEVTALNLRERANILFREMLGVPRNPKPDRGPTFGCCAVGSASGGAGQKCPQRA
jgi:hypothetical protein